MGFHKPRGKARQVFAVATALILLAVQPMSSASAGDWFPELNPGPGDFSFYMFENQQPPLSVIEARIWNRAIDRKPGNEAENWRVCSAYNTQPCVHSPTTFVYASLLAPVCRASETNCIDKIFAEVEGNQVEGQFLGYVSNRIIPATPKLGVMGRGASISLWNIPGLVHSGGTSTYAVKVGVGLQYGEGGLWKYTNESAKFRPIQFQSSIVPYVEVADPFAEDAGTREIKLPSGAITTQFIAPPDACIWAKRGVCGKAVEFGDSPMLGMKLKFQNDFTNWFKARLQDSSIQVSSAGAKSKFITVQGRPVEVPVFAYTLNKDKFPAGLTQQIKALKPDFDGNNSGMFNSDPEAIKMIDLLRSQVSDTAAGTVDFWSFANIENQRGNPCLAENKGIYGLVTSNAMAYQGGPPIYKNGFLNYEVAGMHFLPGAGDLALGSYELSIRSDVARCLYKLSNAPISAKVSVVSDNGLKSFATTTFSEKDGWMKLTAKAFTYSKKVIKAKLIKIKK